MITSVMKLVKQKTSYLFQNNAQEELYHLIKLKDSSEIFTSQVITVHQVKHWEKFKVIMICMPQQEILHMIMNMVHVLTFSEEMLQHYKIFMKFKKKCVIMIIYMMNTVLNHHYQLMIKDKEIQVMLLVQDMI